MPYTQLIAAIEGKAIDDDANEHKEKGNKSEKQIDNVLAQHLEKVFEPSGDMPLINHLLDERELIASIQELKKVYT